MTKSIIGAIAGIIVIVAAVMLFNDNASAPADGTENGQVNEPTPTPTPEITPTPTDDMPAETDDQADASQTVEVSMTDDGFSPAAITVNQGDTVRFVNNGSDPIWPASAPHPTHTNYPEFDPKTGIEPGASWSFTFDRTGRWAYHDHLNPTKFGSVTVNE